MRIRTLTGFFIFASLLALPLQAKDKKEDDHAIQIAKGWIGFLHVPKAHKVEASKDLSKKKPVIWEEWENQKNEDVLSWLPKPDENWKKKAKKSPWPPLVVHNEKKEERRKARQRVDN